MEKESKIVLPSEYLDNRPELVETRIGILKGIVGGVPYIGALMTELMFEIPNRIQQDRINETVGILKLKLNRLSEEMIDEEYLASEDFFDYTRIAIESALKLNTTEKRNCLANIYVDVLNLKSSFDNDCHSLFMKFTAELSSYQILILKFIEEYEKELVEIETYQKFYDLFIDKRNIENLDPYEFKFYCSNLENRSLVSFGAGLSDFNDTTGVIETDSSHKHSSAIISSLGKKLIAYLTTE